MSFSKTWKNFLRCEIDWKVRTLILIIQRKLSRDTEKSNSFNSVEKFLPEDDNFFAQCPKMIKKKELCLKKLFPSKMCLWTQREQFWQLRRKTFNDRRIFFHSMSGKKQIFNIKMSCLKKFLWTRSKHFWLHSWETQNKRLEFFHTKKTQETSPDERLLLRGFLWTLRLQFRQTCQQTFARRRKLLIDVQKFGKKRERFYFFPQFVPVAL